MRTHPLVWFRIQDSILNSFQYVSFRVSLQLTRGRMAGGMREGGASCDFRWGGGEPCGEENIQQSSSQPPAQTRPLWLSLGAPFLQPVPNKPGPSPRPQPPAVHSL